MRGCRGKGGRHNSSTTASGAPNYQRASEPQRSAAQRSAARPDPARRAEAPPAGLSRLSPPGSSQVDHTISPLGVM